MAEMSDSVKQIRAAVLAEADASGNRDAFIQNWNALIDDAIAAVTAAQTDAVKYLALDKKAYALVTAENETVNSSFETVDQAYSDLSTALAGKSASGYDILSVLNTYATMGSNPYSSTIVMANYVAKMGYNIDLIEREQLTRGRDLETLNALKVS